MKIFYDGKHVLSWGGSISKEQAAIEVAGTLDIDADIELISLVPDSSSEIKGGIHKAIAERFGVNGNALSAVFSLIGKIGDPTSLSIDAMVHDLIAIDETSATNYSKARIRLFEEQHGADSWAGAAEFARQWHEGRKSGAISMPFDDKGLAEVIQESAELGGFVRVLLAQMKAQAAPTE